MLRRWVCYATFRLSLRPAKEEDAAFLRKVRKYLPCGSASPGAAVFICHCKSPVGMSGQCWHSTVYGVAAFGKRRLPSSRWLPNLPNLWKSVFVLDSLCSPIPS